MEDKVTFHEAKKSNLAIVMLCCGSLKCCRSELSIFMFLFKDICCSIQQSIIILFIELLNFEGGNAKLKMNDNINSINKRERSSLSCGAVTCSVQLEDKNKFILLGSVPSS